MCTIRIAVAEFRNFCECERNLYIKKFIIAAAVSLMQLFFCKDCAKFSRIYICFTESFTFIIEYYIWLEIQDSELKIQNSRFKRKSMKMLFQKTKKKTHFRKSKYVSTVVLLYIKLLLYTKIP